MFSLTLFCHFPDSATLVLPESGSETDDEGISNVPPETLIFDDDDDDVGMEY